MVSTGLSQLHKGGDEAMVTLARNSPDRVDQWTVEGGEPPAYLGVRYGLTKAGCGIYTRRRPYVHMVFSGVDGAFDVLTQKVGPVDTVRFNRMRVEGSLELGRLMQRVEALTTGKPPHRDGTPLRRSRPVVGIPFALVARGSDHGYPWRVSTDPETDPRVLRSRAATEHDRRETDDAAAAREARRRQVDPLRARDTLIERIIRDAQDAGAFDDLPYTGERLPLENDAAAGDLATAFRILRNAGAAPPWIETDKEIRQLLAEREGILDRASRAGPLSRDRYRAQLRTLVTEVNHLVRILNHETASLRQHRVPLDLHRELEALEHRWPSR